MNQIPTMGYGQSGRIVTRGFFATQTVPAQPRPATVLRDVYRGTVTVSGSVQKVTKLGGSVGGST